MAEESQDKTLQDQLDALKKENFRLRETIGKAKKGLESSEFLEWIKSHTKETVEPTIKEYPLASVLVAFGVGYIISSLFSRR